MHTVGDPRRNPLRVLNPPRSRDDPETQLPEIQLPEFVTRNPTTQSPTIRNPTTRNPTTASPATRSSATRNPTTRNSFLLPLRLSHLPRPRDNHKTLKPAGLPYPVAFGAGARGLRDVRSEAS